MLLLDNEIQKRLLAMPDCIDAVERAFLALETGRAIYRPKTDVNVPTSRQDGYYRFGSMEGWFDGIFAIRFMSDVMVWEHRDDGSWREDNHAVEPGTRCAIVLLFSSDTGAPLAMLKDDYIQHMRVGASAALGTARLARPEAKTVAMLGSGGMAETFLTGLAAVRALEAVRVYSPTRRNREDYAAKMAAALGLAVEPVDSAQAAMAGADIVATCTNSGAPVFEAAWLEPGQHVVSVGTNEVPPDAVPRFDVAIRQGVSSMKPDPSNPRHVAAVGLSYAGLIAGTAAEMARIPKGGAAHIDASDFPQFVDLASGRAPGRTSDGQITFYYCHGNQGLQFAAVGGLAYRKALEAGLGQPIPQDWWLQKMWR